VAKDEETEPTYAEWQAAIPTEGTYAEAAAWVAHHINVVNTEKPKERKRLWSINHVGDLQQLVFGTTHKPEG